MTYLNKDTCIVTDGVSIETLQWLESRDYLALRICIERYTDTSIIIAAIVPRAKGKTLASCASRVLHMAVEGAIQAYVREYEDDD